MQTLSATVTLSLIINVKEGIDISEFLLHDTEWIGEPRNADGCVVAINPKSISIIDKKKDKK